MGNVGMEGIAGIFVALLFMAAPWLIIAGIVVLIARRSRLWKALTERVQEGGQGERIAALEGEVAELRLALAEMQERQDFAERVLSNQTERP